MMIIIVCSIFRSLSMLLPLEKNIRIIKDQINFLNLTIEEIFFIENWIISKKGRILWEGFIKFKLKIFHFSSNRAALSAPFPSPPQPHETPLPHAGHQGFTRGWGPHGHR